MESETNGLDYRYTYGLEKVSAVISPIENGAGGITENGKVKLYYHHDRLGTTDYLTDNVKGKVTSYIDYDAWGAPIKKAILKLGVRELDLVTEYTGHPYDPVLGMYFAEARMYDAGDRRFASVDPVKGTGRNPQTLAGYTYVTNNPLKFVDPLGLLKQGDILKFGTGDATLKLSTPESIDVMLLQKRLQELGYLKGFKNYGYFDKQTEEAVEKKTGSKTIYMKLWLALGLKEEGSLVIMQHGLNDDADCFEETLNNIFNTYGSEYMNDIGFVSQKRDNEFSHSYFAALKCYFGLTLEQAKASGTKYLEQVINIITKKGKMAFVRTEFSTGFLSFDDQYKELEALVALFGNHDADVAFVGHSMGGLASINYGMDYAGAHSDKEVKIITIDTPYHPNKYANINYSVPYAESISKQPASPAHFDLADFSDKTIGRSKAPGALTNLRSKWNSYKTNGGTADLHAISVSMYSKKEEPNWSGKGDGIVDIPSQQGVGWSNVNEQPIIFGTGVGHASPFDDANDLSNPYHHVNTPNLIQVMSQLKSVLG